MGRKKKPFIDKKKASTYHLLHRSQQDVDGHVLQQELAAAAAAAGENDEGFVVSTSNMILWPSPNNNPETDRAVLLATTTITKAIAIATTDQQNDSISTKQLQPKDDKYHNNNNSKTIDGKQRENDDKDVMYEWRGRLLEAGLLADDPNKYMKPVTGRGTFIDASTGRQQQQQQHAYNSKNNYVVEEDEDDLDEMDIIHGLMLSPEEAALMGERKQRQLESIAVSAAYMDEDMAQALEGDFDENDFEEMNDDFLLMAAAEEEIQPSTTAAATTKTTDTFDYDEHIQKLIAKAKMERELMTSATRVPTNHTVGLKDEEFFARLEPLHENERNDDDDDSWEGQEYNDSWDEEEPTSKKHQQQDKRMMIMSQQQKDKTAVPLLSPDEERALCEQFELTLAEYDDDSDDENKDVMGTPFNPSNNDNIADNDEDGDEIAEHEQEQQMEQEQQIMEAACDAFLEEKKDEILMQGTASDGKKKTAKSGGSGYSALIGGTMVNAKDIFYMDPLLNNNGNSAIMDEPPIAVVLAQAEQRLSLPPVQPPDEDVFFDGQKSYYSQQKERNPFDCESILSTYSNLDNNPVTIGSTSGGRRKGRRSKQSSQKRSNTNDPIQQIQLSNKTGLPVGVFSDNQTDNNNSNDNKNDDDELFMETTVQSVNRGVRRDRNESAADKKLRKQMTKQERQLQRLQKKMTKEIFQQELDKHAAVTNSQIGTAVCRYS